jgi:Zn-dependent M28 family amino/carboxypeptidase
MPTPTSTSPTAAPSAPLPAFAATAAKLRDTVLASSQAFDIVRSLSDEAGHRLAGSPGNRAAVAWALRMLPQYGLQNVRAEKAMAPHWERGPASAAITAPHPHSLAVLALGGSVATPKGGIEAEVIEAASVEAIGKLDKAAVKGKIVYVSTVTERAKDGSGYGKAAGARVQSASAAAKLGAVAVVIRSIGTDNNRLPHTGGMRYEDGVPKIPAAALSIPDAELLGRLLRTGKPVRLRLELAAKTHGEVEAPNVVGEVVGRSAPDEVILLGAHIDSWDVGTGAIDDGAGCATIIEAARQILKLPERPRRTVRIVLFNNEENGLGGARAYAKTHENELGKHIVALESDFGAGRVWSARYLGAPASRKLFLSITELLGPLGVEVPEIDARGGADLIPLRPAGVPIVDLLPDGTTYFDYHHTDNDTLDKINKDELDQAAAAFATFAYAAAEMAGDFGRVPDDKRAFR